MALAPMTLQERIKKSQDLAKKSTTELAAQQGLEQAPVTAVGVGAMGGTPQQQAMAGTPAQKKAVLEAVAAPRAETNLELAQKIKPTTAADTAKQQEVQKYSQSLGTYGDKISQWIEGVLSSTAKETKAALALTPEQQKTIDTTKSGLSAADSQSLDAALNTLKAQNQPETLVRDALFNLNRLLGKTTTSSLLSGTAYQELYNRDIAGQVGEQLEAGVQARARGADSKLTLQDITTLGTTPEELKDLLNLPAETDPLTLSLGEMQNRLAQVQQEAFSQVQQAQAGRASALLSDVEKEALRGTVLQLEEAGIAGAEQQFQQLLNSIDAGSTVNVAGTDYTVDELLADDTVSAIADKYFANNKEDSAWRERFLREEPELARWLEDNRTGLQVTLAAGAGQADKLVAHNKALDQVRNLFQGTGILESAGLSKEYLPGTVLPITKTLEWSPAAVGTTISDIVSLQGPEQTTAVANLRNAMASIPDTIPNKEQFAKDLLGAGAQALQLTNSNSPVIGNLIASMSEYDNFARATSPQDKLNLLFLDDRTIEDINNILKSDVRRSQMGLDTSAYFQYDANKDGTLSDDEINQILSRVKPPTVRDVIAGQTFAYNALGSQVPAPLQGLDQVIFDAMADGRVDAAELSALPLDQLGELFNKRGRPGEGGRGAEGAIDKGVRDAYLQGLAQAVNQSFTSLGLDAGGLVPDWDARTRPDNTNRYPGMNDKDYQDFLDVQTYRKQIPLYTQSIDALRKLANETANPDLKWRLNTKADELTNARNMAQSQVRQYESSPKAKPTVSEQLTKAAFAPITAGGAEKLVSAVTGLPIQVTQIPIVKKGIEKETKNIIKNVKEKVKKPFG